MLDFTKNTGVLSLALILAGFGAAAAAVLAVVAEITAPAIENAQQKSRNKILLTLLPENVANDPSSCNTEYDGIIYFGGFDAVGDLLGIVAKSSANGYAGPVEIYTGMTPEGTVVNVCAGKHNETPGLGSVVLERRLQATITDPFPVADGLPPNEILDWFSQKNGTGEPWKIEKDGGGCKFRTGATITSRAVCGAVWDAAENFAEHREEITELLRMEYGSN